MVKKLTTRVYLIVGLIAAVGLLLYGIKYSTHLYSPGDLAKAHSNIKDCSACHKPFRNISSSQCLNAQCHPMDKITSLSKITGGLHARVKDKDCILCHSEHKGVSGKITIRFEHELLGKDAKNCMLCHKADYDKVHPDKYKKDCMLCHTIKDWKAISFDHKKFENTGCIDCHKPVKDELHRDADNICQNCHTTDKWSPARFEHEKFFPITDVHKTSCATCHEKKYFKKYTCLNCHEHNTLKIKSEHMEEGIFNYGDCLRCHSATINNRSYGTAKVHEGFGGEDEEEDDD